MKKIAIAALLSSVAMLVVSNAYAESLSSQKMADSDFGGFYIGGFGGYALFNEKHTAVTANPTFPAGFNFNPQNYSGAAFGGHAGYNFQVSNWVYGVEAEYSQPGTQGSTATNSPLIAGYTTVGTGKVDWLNTVTGRIGYDWDGLLGYVKGGGAQAKVTGGSTLYNAQGVMVTGHRTKSMNVNGWVLGTGLEYRLSKHLSAGIEYNYVQFKKTTVVTPDKTFGLMETRIHDANLQVVKLGVNYLF